MYQLSDTNVKIKKRHSFNPAHTASIWVVPLIFLGLHLMVGAGGNNEWMIWVSVLFAFTTWAMFNWKVTDY